mmetsp:Transcript_2537/g.5102  ORF Transcript_2537/g.5102 Transcript_2537/m.5102 type:complete len:225 (+) Transcript_2537:121-795(+)
MSLWEPCTPCAPCAPKICDPVPRGGNLMARRSPASSSSDDEDLGSQASDDAINADASPSERALCAEEDILPRKDRLLLSNSLMPDPLFVNHVTVDQHRVVCKELREANRRTAAHAAEVQELRKALEESKVSLQRMLKIREPLQAELEQLKQDAMHALEEKRLAQIALEEERVKKSTAQVELVRRTRELAEARAACEQLAASHGKLRAWADMKGGVRPAIGPDEV